MAKQPGYLHPIFEEFLEDLTPVITAALRGQDHKTSLREGNLVQKRAEQKVRDLFIDVVQTSELAGPDTRRELTKMIREL